MKVNAFKLAVLLFLCNTFFVFKPALSAAATLVCPDKPWNQLLGLTWTARRAAAPSGLIQRSWSLSEADAL